MQVASASLSSLLVHNSEGVLINLRGEAHRQSGQQLLADAQCGKRFLEGETAQWLHTNL